MQTHFRLAIVLAALLPLSTAGAQDAVYKWVDEQGRVHYSDQQPDAVKDPETIEIFDAPEDAPSRSAAHERELKRIRELSEELEAAREDRERERLERRLIALERAYYQQLAEEEEQQDREKVIVFPHFFHGVHPHFPHPPKKKFFRGSEIPGHHPFRHGNFDTLPGPGKPGISDSAEQRHTSSGEEQRPTNTRVEPPRIRSMGIRQ